MRKMLFHDRLFSGLIRSSFRAAKFRNARRVILNDSKIDSVPYPAVDRTGFISSIDDLIETEDDHCNAIK